MTHPVRGRTLHQPPATNSATTSHSPACGSVRLLLRVNVPERRQVAKDDVKAHLPYGVRGDRTFRLSDTGRPGAVGGAVHRTVPHPAPGNGPTRDATVLSQVCRTLTTVTAEHEASPVPGRQPVAG